MSIDQFTIDTLEEFCRLEVGESARCTNIEHVWHDNGERVQSDQGTFEFERWEGGFRARYVFSFERTPTGFVVRLQSKDVRL